MFPVALYVLAAVTLFLWSFLDGFLFTKHHPTWLPTSAVGEEQPSRAFHGTLVKDEQSPVARKPYFYKVVALQPRTHPKQKGAFLEFPP